MTAPAWILARGHGFSKANAVGRTGATASESCLLDLSAASEKKEPRRRLRSCQRSAGSIARQAQGQHPPRTLARSRPASLPAAAAPPRQHLEIAGSQHAALVAKQAANAAAPEVVATAGAAGPVADGGAAGGALVPVPQASDTALVQVAAASSPPAPGAPERPRSAPLGQAGVRSRAALLRPWSGRTGPSMLASVEWVERVHRERTVCIRRSNSAPLRRSPLVAAACPCPDCVAMQHAAERAAEKAGTGALAEKVLVWESGLAGGGPRRGSGSRAAAPCSKIPAATLPMSVSKPSRSEALLARAEKARSLAAQADTADRAQHLALMPPLSPQQQALEDRQACRPKRDMLESLAQLRSKVN